MIIALKACSLDWCSRQFYAKGYCRIHYGRDKRGTDLTKPYTKLYKGKICRVEGCMRDSRAFDYCLSHYNRLKKNQPIDTPINIGSGIDEKTKKLKNAHRSMIKRCTVETNRAYKYYGGRGIRVCSRWTGENGFDNFLSDMGHKPTSKHSLDRINNDGNYEPSNCRWADNYTQQHNKRHKLSKSGLVGVCFRKDKSKWHATISIRGKTKHLGYFDTANEASLAFQNSYEHLLLANNPL